MTELDLTKLPRPLESYICAVRIRLHSTGYCVRAQHFSGADYLGTDLDYKESGRLVSEFNSALRAHKAMLK